MTRYEIMLGKKVPLPDRKLEGWSAPVDTVEDLVAELNRQMSGYKDKHDRYIENCIGKICEGSVDIQHRHRSGCRGRAAGGAPRR